MAPDAVEPVELVVASANPDKAAEIESILAEELGDAVRLSRRPLDIPDVEESATTFEGNAHLKAAAVQAATGRGSVADDSGLEVDALGGVPGVRSARYAGDGASYADNVAKLLHALTGVLDRGARFRTVAVAHLADGRELVCEGTVEGSIATAPRGVGGFGYDPVFVPAEGDGRTFAEMTAAEKHAISARGRALRCLAVQLRDEIGR
jgi:XTP/dITP diphosphohydrolase